jgi:hypothetical protein
MSAKRLTGPLFWLHGDESPERLREYVKIMAESGNGCFTAESRPHNDWLGEGWYRDLAICLEAAKKHDMKMWIFDERWWPSQMVGGKVPPQYGSKTLVARAVDAKGPGSVTVDDCGGREFIGAIAGRDTGNGIDGSSLVDLTSRVRGGTLSWRAPAGKWKVMTFRWKFTGAKGMQKKWIAVDGASPDCVDWFIKHVYQPHYDRFGSDFGKTIPGYFYDEPETLGDWGSDVMTLLKERGINWIKPFVAWKFKLAGEEDVAAKYQYADAFAESWGRTMYGGMSKWCGEHDVVSMGHFMEHGNCLFSRKLSAGNMFQLQKYSDMGGIDLVCRQFYPGQKKTGLWQMARLGSSISHVYGKKDDVAMCEIFGAYGQSVTYPQMKWLTDQMQVRGINYMVPHSFNPRAPHDRDCPPYFYNGGYEPRYPLYRVYADYTSRLSLMLAGGRHVAPVAFLFMGQSYHFGKKIRPDEMSNALDDALFDCDWMPYDAFADARIDGPELALHNERYRVLVVPAAEVIPYETLEKVKAFYDAGGIVVGYGILPTASATLGRTSADIARLRAQIWGESLQMGTRACRTNGAGGRSYFLTAKPTSSDIRAALSGDAGIHPDLEVASGDTHDWLHVLHRVMRDGRHVFLVCNQDHKRAAKQFTFLVRAPGHPECWDAMRGEFTSVHAERAGDHVRVSLSLEPSESVLLVFNPDPVALPQRIEQGMTPKRTIAVNRLPGGRSGRVDPGSVGGDTASPGSFSGASWIWHAADGTSIPPCTRLFRKTFEIPAGRKVKSARAGLSVDNSFELFVNGRKAGSSSSWETPSKIDIAELLRPGKNALCIRAANGGDAANPAGVLARFDIALDDGKTIRVATDAGWRSASSASAQWTSTSFVDSDWSTARVCAAYGAAPWGSFSGKRRGGRLTLSPVAADTFLGEFTLPPDIDLASERVFIRTTAPSPEDAAAITVNGKYAGGFLCGPYRLDVSRAVTAGRNTIRIEPFAPASVEVVVY